MKLAKYSIGIGDRFGHQGKALLTAIMKAEEKGINITPVWNKSFREHQITGTTPISVLMEAKKAAKELKWKGDYFIDADHVNLNSIDIFLDSSNYFTLDVSDSLSKPYPEEKVKKFVKKYKKLIEDLELPSFNFEKNGLEKVAKKYLPAVKEAKRMYNKIVNIKKEDSFIIEISIDEVEDSQSPNELLIILCAVSDEEIPIQAIAPKFIGRFIKGVDFQGDTSQFKNHFESLLRVIQCIKTIFPLMNDLKLSIHSGSDKFSIYPIINELIKKNKAGIHLKTAGTTWLEEVIGLVQSGFEGLEMVKEIYKKAYYRFDELSNPYKKVIDINQELLPSPQEVLKWSVDEMVNCLRHDISNKNYNPHFRQFFHIAYKIAAEMRDSYEKVLEKYKEIISKNVVENIYKRHIQPLFM